MAIEAGSSGTKEREQPPTPNHFHHPKWWVETRKKGKNVWFVIYKRVSYTIAQTRKKLGVWFGNIINVSNSELRKRKIWRQLEAVKHLTKSRAFSLLINVAFNCHYINALLPNGQITKANENERRVQKRLKMWWV